MLPHAFKERMKKLLSDGYDEFEYALTNENAVRGIRINPLKCSDEDFISRNDIELISLGYVEHGYLPNTHIDGIGNTPMHHAGEIYIQDPGAMASVSSLEIKEGMWVADLCAAPGGKSTQIASLLSGTGFILSNEYVPKRAKILVSNFERMGITNGMVTSLDTARLAEMFDGVFDIVVADAPCSGEGMFRKDVPAIQEWSEDNVDACAVRQKEILNNAAKLVKRGGKLLYSTCTYSLEENEMVIDNFLSEHGDFRLNDVPKALYEITADGIFFDGAKTENLCKCRRFYPHISPGEGQFIALLEKNGGGEGKILYKDDAKVATKEEISLITNFFRDNLKETPKGKISKHGDNLVLISHECPIPKFGVFCSGVLIGEIKGKILIPSHQFYSAYGKLFKRQENIKDKIIAEKYLSGEEINASFNSPGFCSVLWHGSPLGGGKMSAGKIKNHYPKGLRLK